MTSQSLDVPSDKSISHRLLFLSLYAHQATISNLSYSEDVQSTLALCKALFPRRYQTYHNQIIANFKNPIQDQMVLNCNNSGTTARHMIAFLASLPPKEGVKRWSIYGDSSLLNRPMDRIIHPLQNAGALIHYLDKNKYLPITITSKQLSPINYDTTLASAQIKSALIFAGLQIPGHHQIKVGKGSRNHTELLLTKLGLKLDKWENESHETLSFEGPFQVPNFDFKVPGDPSSAAFFCGLALLCPQILPFRLNKVCFNENRLTFLKKMSEIGLQYQLIPRDIENYCEPVVDIELLGVDSILKPLHINPSEVPSLIDELPLLITLCGFVNGTSSFRGLAELRHKESDRLYKSAELLHLLGRQTQIDQEQLVVHGHTDNINPFSFATSGDHRLAMIAGLVAQRCKQKSTIDHKDCVKVSYPNFWEDLQKVCGHEYQEVHCSR